MTAETSPPPSPDTDPGRRERKRQQTLDHLAATAFRLFEAHGFEAVTMEQVAAEADVAKGTLYNHFPVKEALLAHLLHSELAGDIPRLRAAIEAAPDFAARMTCLLHASADWSARHRTYLVHYLRFRLANAVTPPTTTDAKSARSGLDQVFEALIRQGQASGELRADLPPAQLAQMFQFLYLSALLRWVAAPDSDLRAEFDATLHVFLHGLIATPDHNPTRGKA
ncbi:TetR/AcrR family transcriptional regulator [Andreprevotia chitinilytica]|uniref:TetR/AcrR family transcriptional regulator n=1 Tax=Andreprevotia chitinilytica TaxID=396808 RepID=UPI00068AD0ED|nr:TetR/AcrR family transcriptional regulator [Andreprevotia chitinilytica]